MRWILFLQQLNFEFKYRPGNMLQNADTMSRILSMISTRSLGSISEAQLNDDQLSQAIKILQNGDSLPQEDYAEHFYMMGCSIASFGNLLLLYVPAKLVILEIKF